MSGIPEILSKVDGGKECASDELLLSLYGELRRLAAHKMAKESPDNTLDATALVHEAYLQLVGTAEGKMWDSESHFFAAIAEVMRRILVDRARQKSCQRRGGRFERQDLDPAKIPAPENACDILAVHEALDRFERIDKSKADLVKLRYFAGLTIPEAAGALGISTATADRAWAYARAWLHAELKRGISDLGR